MAAVEDCVANKVLQECCQDIMDHINTDEVIMRLHSKSRLTVEELNRLESIPTTQEKKRQLYIIALANKGSAAFEDILEVLNDTSSVYKPHAVLANKLSKRYKCLSRRLTQGHSAEHADQPAGEVIRTMKETGTAYHLESRISSDENDYDQREQSLPDVAIEATAQTNRSCLISVKQKGLTIPVNPSPGGHGLTTAASGPATSVFLSISVLGSPKGVAQLSSSIQNTGDDTMCQPSSTDRTPTLINTGQPVGVTGRVDQPTADINASTVTKESGFSDSFTCSEHNVLRKCSIPLLDMIPIKLILLGDSGVGKTSFAQRYLNGVYHDNSPVTIGSTHDQRYYQHLQKRINIKLSIWDTAGQERFKWITPNYYHKANVAIVIFDMTRQSTLLSVCDWKTQVSRHLPNNTKIPILLVGNKCDSPEVIYEIRRYAQQIADRYDFNGFIEASAKDNLKVENIFETAVTLALEHYESPDDAIVSLDKPHKQQHQRQGCKC